MSLFVKHVDDKQQFLVIIPCFFSDDTVDIAKAIPRTLSSHAISVKAILVAYLRKKTSLGPSHQKRISGAK